MDTSEALLAVCGPAQQGGSSTDTATASTARSTSNVLTSIPLALLCGSDHQLKAKIPHLDAVLPKKQFLGNRSPDFIKMRQKELQKYLDHLMWNRTVVQNEEFRLFFIPVRRGGHCDCDL